ncbi:hypothetical protein [Gordonia rhizosphera]|uniref:Uncharacterized protein n=1 Tax=Gordonia rhizosphera NBRC 16068 TaxID=1108045 RepID=K6X1R2_9ACTN|nr:hypothetical protein [Gordonia rhizosphera]GAB92739.1 hypothetical protein GORHZ_189_00130 [Gordonia rhizosphera NBRC 16068]
MRKRASGYGLWERAVQRGGVGHTAAAFTILNAVGRIAHADDDDVLASLALSTRASLLRQAGRHDAAAPLDGRALVYVGADPGDDPWHRAAVLDAMVGLAADDLGLLRFDAARRLLARARRMMNDRDDDWFAGRRPRLRVEWVSAELAVYTGRPASACHHADAAMRLCEADDTPERHRVKTQLIAAAAAAAAGDVDIARDLAAHVTTRARDAGLLPLLWASLALRRGFDPADQGVEADLARVRAELIARGVPFPADTGGAGRPGMGTHR